MPPRRGSSALAGQFSYTYPLWMASDPQQCHYLRKIPIALTTPEWGVIGESSTRTRPSGIDRAMLSVRVVRDPGAIRRC